MAGKTLEITQHGKCRMQCRGVDLDEVKDVLRTGRIDENRTRHDGRCSSYAIEGKGSDGARLRVVYAACDRETRVVTAIDLDRDPPCTCE